MSENKLTDSKLKSFLGKPQERQLTIADGLGLSARVSKKGGISWLYRFRFRGESNPNWVTLGKYPDITLKQARIERDKCREWVAQGIDPRIERKIPTSQRQMEALSVKGALDFWLREYASTKRANADKHEMQFKKWVYGKIGSFPIAKITKEHWIECLEDRAKLYPVAAGYVLQNVQQALKFCQKKGYEIDPGVFDLDIDSIGAKRQRKKNRTLIEEDSWNEFLDLVNWLNEGRIAPYYRHLVLLLVAFGARTQELRLSQVSEWNLETMVWTVPPENNKTSKREVERGYSGEIKRPIPQELIPLITHLIDDSKNGFLLGELKSPETVSVFGGGIWKKLNHQNKWSLHDLRRTVATGMSDLEIDPYIVEAMLGHSLGGVQGIYNRSHYLSKKQKALEVWVNKLVALGLNLNPLFSVVGGK
ncbi:site-specific integrase [Vibrio parahaemolyticus]|uniref:tyrosine-type recombinase/integrase n=1 Tax=Vibrio parahaemolyticus TaxID=670 RepID=UPI00226AF511|nr:site-specific integrase [Vibrio parahaemolyticus]EHK0752607.1 site-specific integrase [Vibrio parahaemolyticus]MCX8932098.1 site-specific integrase [Vibrio parahaemolyticus]